MKTITLKQANAIRLNFQELYILKLVYSKDPRDWEKYAEITQEQLKYLK